MNLAEYIVKFPKHFKPIAKPFYVIACDDHFIVCTLVISLNPITSLGPITKN